MKMTREEALKLIKLEPSATLDEIDKQIKDLLKAIHPDKVGQNPFFTDTTQKILDAKEILLGGHKKNKQGKFEGAKDKMPNSPGPEPKNKETSGSYDVFESVKNYARRQPMNSSADGGGMSNYYIPNTPADMDKITQMFSEVGVKYDIRHSNALNATVVRVFQKDISEYYDRRKQQDEQPVFDPELELFNWANMKSMASSADGTEGSYYFTPKDGQSHDKIQNLLNRMGIKFDLHNSSYMGGTVVRVMKKDMPTTFMNIWNHFISVMNDKSNS